MNTLLYALACPLCSHNVCNQYCSPELLSTWLCEEKEQLIKKRKFKLIDMFCLDKGDVCSASHPGTGPQFCRQLFPCDPRSQQCLEYNPITHCHSGTEQPKPVPLKSAACALGQFRTWFCKHLTCQTRPSLQLAYIPDWEGSGPWHFLPFQHFPAFCVFRCYQFPTQLVTMLKAKTVIPEISEK